MPDSPPRSPAFSAGVTGRPVTGSMATLGRPVTGSMPERIMASLRARRMRVRATSASPASTLPSRSMSHFRINSSREDDDGVWATPGSARSAITPHTTRSRPWATDSSRACAANSGRSLGIMQGISIENSHQRTRTAACDHPNCTPPPPKTPTAAWVHAVGGKAGTTAAVMRAAIRAAATAATPPACSSSRAATWQCTAWPSMTVAGGSVCRQTCSARGQRG